MAPRPQNLTGQRFGMLLAIERTDRMRKREAYWRCRCDCGEAKEVLCSLLKNGSVRSCGCAHHRLVGEAHITHGHSRGGASPTYRSWQTMIQRCESPTHKSFSAYGGRGIKVCGRWRKFADFLADMGSRPSLRHTLERIKNGRGYEPGNCRWATAKEQARNRRSTRLITWGERTQPLAAWAEETGLDRVTISDRLKRGWTVGAALTRPANGGAPCRN